MMSVAAASWQIEGYCGKLHCGSTEGRVEPAALGEWFQLVKWRGANVDSLSVLYTDIGEPYDYNLLSRHVRGCDLVDVFPKSTAHISNEAIWRATFHRTVDALQLELVCSTQTDLLDSNPEKWITSHVSGAQVFCCHNLESKQFLELHPPEFPGIEYGSHDAPSSLLLFRNERIGVSYAEMVHPTDYVRSQVFSSDGGHLLTSISVLFPDRLEKGVIRRGRVCGWFLPAQNDLATAVELARQFVNEPLPLTT